jgi:polysaccharide deacetylase family protein (PEP-CTERM system associated)
MLNALTVDVEDCYHICGLEEMFPPAEWGEYEDRVLIGLEKLLGVLRQYATKATFFILGYVAERNPQIVRAIKADGHEIATHGYNHIQIYRQTKPEFQADLQKSIRIIEGISKTKIIGYRAPEWSIRKDTYWALDILQEEGLKYDSSMLKVKLIGEPTVNRYLHRIETKNGDIFEFPPTIMPTFMGNMPIATGWGLRFGIWWDVKRTIRNLNNEHLPALFCIHSWELDLAQPRYKLPFWRSFVHYTKLKSTSYKLHKLLEEFEFGPIREVLKL